MKLRSAAVAVLFAGLGLTIACGGGSPGASTPTPVTLAPTPSPVATASPAPSPSPTPCTQGLCEDPVTNTAPPDKVTLRIYYVQYPNSNELARCDQSDPIPVGYEVGLDVVAKDIRNKETRGSGNVDWEYSDESLVEIRPNQPFQRRLNVVKAGNLVVYAILDGVRSNRLAMTFQEGTKNTACK